MTGGAAVVALPEIPAAAAHLTSMSVRADDCSRYSSDGGSPECEERAQVGVGALVVVAVVLLTAGTLAWRLMLRKVDRTSPPAEPGNVADPE